MFPSVLAQPRETVQEMDCEDILEGIISHVIVEDATALAHSVLGEYDAKLIKLQQHQVLSKYVWQHGLLISRKKLIPVAW